MWLWFNMLGVPSSLIDAGASPPFPGALSLVSSLSWQAVFALVMLLLGFLAPVLDREGVRKGFAVAIGVLTLARSLIVVLDGDYAANLVGLIASQIALALALHGWIVRTRGLGGRVILRDGALSFIVGGALFLPVQHVPFYDALLVALPLVFSSIMLFASGPAKAMPRRSALRLATEAKRALASLPTLLTASVVLAGFVITPAATQTMSASLSPIAIGMLYAGVALVFLALTSPRTPTPENCLGFMSVAVMLVALMGLLFPESGSVAPMLATACYWACFAIVFATKHPYVLVALYVFAEKVGVACHAFGYSGRYLNLVLVGALVAVSIAAFSKRRSGSDDERTADEPSAAFDERCRLFSQAMHFTNREAEVFSLLMKGDSARRIAEDLVLSGNTIKTYRSNIYQKTGVSSRQELLDRFRAFE